jgi:hypothetical protein
LRFTLHRPSQNSAGSTCCHAMACRDVSGRVHVGVRPVPASHTYEPRLALATARCDVFAGVTGLRRAGYTPRRAPMGSCEELPPRLVKVPQPLLLDGLRPAGKPRRRPSGGSQLCGLGVEARCGPLPPRPQQVLLQGKVPHVPGVAALLGQQHLLRGVRVQAEPHGTQRSAGHRHPGGTRTPVLAVVAASSMICRFTGCSSPSTGVACSTRRCSTGANTSWPRCAWTSGRPGRVQRGPRPCPPARAVPAEGGALPPRQLPGGCLVQAPAAGLRWQDQTALRRAASSGPRHTSPGHTSPGHTVARHCPQSRTTSPTRNDQPRQGLLPARKGTVSTPDHR